MHALFRSIRHKALEICRDRVLQERVVWSAPESCPSSHRARGIQNEWITSELSSWNSIDSPRGSRISLAKTTSGPF